MISLCYKSLKRKVIQGPGRFWGYAAFFGVVDPRQGSFEGSIRTL